MKPISVLKKPSIDEQNAKVEKQIAQDFDASEHIKWLAHPRTRVLLHYLLEQENDYLLKTRRMLCATPEDPTTATKYAVMSKTIREVIDYVNRSKGSGERSSG